MHHSRVALIVFLIDRSDVIGLLIQLYQSKHYYINYLIVCQVILWFIFEI